METQYQLILLGNKNNSGAEIEKVFNDRIEELGLKVDRASIIKAQNFDIYKSNAPSVCLYFGGESNFSDTEILNLLIADSCLVIPVVEELKQFSSLVPQVLRPINGFELNKINSPNKIPTLVSRILEGLSLLRKSRKLFISYRRIESRSIALQLYGFLDECGFNVFLDTHSIGPGAKFQDELWHSLADTDILVLLNTENFVGNKWTDQELAQAAAMSIGILQLVWPNCDYKKFIGKTALATPVYLKDADFVNNDYIDEHAKITNDFLKLIEQDVESLRARALAARQDNLVKEFFKAAERHSIDATLQSEKIIVVSNIDDEKIVVIPTVGVPDVYASYEKENLIKDIWKSEVKEVWILYDHRNVLTPYLVFVTWLSPLSVKFLKITDIDNWFKKI